MPKYILAAITVLFMVSELSAQPKLPDDGVLRFMSAVSRNPGNVASFRQGALKRFSELDIDGNGFEQSDIDLYLLKDRARIRSVAIAAWAKNDLNADGTVSRDELERLFARASRQYLRGNGIVIKPSAEQVRQALDALVKNALGADIDNNGVLTLYEVMAASDAGYTAPNNAYTFTNQMLSFDANQDGRVPQDEFEKVLDGFMDWVDVDKNGTIDSTERGVFVRSYQAANRATYTETVRVREERERAKDSETCGRLEVPDGVSTVVVGGYEGKALSTVRIGNEGNVTSVIDLKVGIGFGKIFLMLDSYHSVIWRISGQTHRIAGVGIDAEVAGVIGIPEENVQYFNGQDCALDIWKHSGTRGTGEALLLTSVLGREPDVIISGYELGGIKIPSGVALQEYHYSNVLSPLTSLAGRKVEADMLRFNPGGIVKISPETVASRTQVSTYEMLPQEAGLARLAELGAIQPAELWLHTPIHGLRMGRDGIEIPASSGRFVKSSAGDDLFEDAGKTFRIVGGSVERSFIGERMYILRERIDIPIGLDGAHSVIFLLPDDVPPPRGRLAGSELRALEE